MWKSFLVLSLALVGCSKSEASPSPTPESRQAEQKATNFTVDASAGECKKDQECAITVTLKTLNEFHLNKSYPYKLTVEDASGIDWQGKKVFSKQTGDFAEQGETVGVLTARFKATKAGATTVKGKFKMSVCSKDKCQLDEPEVQVALNVK
jgi:hypothetical protein